MSTNNPLRPDQIDPTKSIQPSQEMEEGTPGNFADYMKQPSAVSPQGPQAPSPVQILGGSQPIQGPSLDTINQQMNTSQYQLQDINAQLQTPGLKIRTQDKELLDSKLSQANTHLRTLNTTLGVNPGPQPQPSNGPFGKFLGLINDGLSQIDAAKQHLSHLSSDPNKLNPADMLLVQVKINQAQQQIEFSSVILSKIVDDFKQLMNIQI